MILIKVSNLSMVFSYDIMTESNLLFAYIADRFMSTNSKNVAFFLSKKDTHTHLIMDIFET